MAGHGVNDIIANLRRVQIWNEIVEGDQIELMGQQVEVVISTRAIQGIVGEVATPTSVPTSLITIIKWCIYLYTTKCIYPIYLIFTSSIEVGNSIVDVSD